MIRNWFDDYLPQILCAAMLVVVGCVAYAAYIHDQEHPCVHSHKETRTTYIGMTTSNVTTLVPMTSEVDVCDERKP